MNIHITTTIRDHTISSNRIIRNCWITPSTYHIRAYVSICTQILDMTTIHQHHNHELGVHLIVEIGIITITKIHIIHFVCKIILTNLFVIIIVTEVHYYLSTANMNPCRSNIKSNGCLDHEPTTHLQNHSLRESL